MKKKIYYLILGIMFFMTFISAGCKTVDDDEGTEILEEELTVSAQLLSPLTGEPTNVASQGEERTLEIEVKLGNRAVENKLITVSTTAGLFIETENELLLSDEHGKSSVTWLAGSITGAGTITVSVDGAVNTAEVNFIIIPFDSSESSGQADQDSFSFGTFETFSAEAWQYDGETIELYVMVADRYNHPVVDGTVVNFYAESGSIDTYCSTTNGACNVTWTSQAPRPTEPPGKAGRVTIMASTRGNESFADANDDSLFNSGDILQDLTEAYLDANENGVFDWGELFLDNNGDGIFTDKDGKYNGVLCEDFSVCSKELIDVRSSLVLIMSGSTAYFTISPSRISLNHTYTSTTVNVTINDVNGNTIPYNSKVTISIPEDLVIDNVKILQGAEDISLESSGGTDEGGSTDGSSNAISFTVGSDAGSLGPLKLSFKLSIPDEMIESGIDIEDYLTIEATTPKGHVSSRQVNVKAFIPEDLYEIDIQMFSTANPNQDIYSINKGETAILRATITDYSKPIIHEMVTFSVSKGFFVEIEDGTVLTNENGIAEILWETGDTAGAGIITVKAGETEATRFFEIIPVIDDDPEEDYGLEMSVDLLSTLTGSPIYTITQGEDAILEIKAWRGDIPAAKELITVSSTMGTFIETQNGTVLTNENGEVSLTWRAGNETGAGYITVSAVNEDLTLEPAVKFMVIPFDNSQSSAQADQDSFSFAMDQNDNRAVEGLNYDGEEINFTVRVADRYNHPVPEGTVVDFYTEGGAITETAKTNSQGICSATWRSQEPRPYDGRVTIMAVTKGDETFLDANDDSLYTYGIDILSTDMPEAFLDADEDGMYDPGVEFFLDNNNDGRYTYADGLYNGSLCYYGSNCTDKLIDIRGSQVIVMSGSFADITVFPLYSITLDKIYYEKEVSLTVQDENENTMPHGTTVEITAPEGLEIKNIKISSGTIKELNGDYSNKITFNIDDTLGHLALSFSLYIPDEGRENGININDNLVINVTTPKLKHLTSKSIAVYAYIPEPAQ